MYWYNCEGASYFLKYNTPMKFIKNNFKSPKGWFYILIMFVGCTSLPKSKIIAFSEDIKNNYPDESYLTAWGSSKSLGEARENAKGNLAAIFSAKIEDNTLLSQNIQQKNSLLIKHQYLSRSTLVTARSEIEGIAVPKDFFDEESKLYYVLAVLNRAEAETRWLDQLNNNYYNIKKIELELNKDIPPYRAIYLLQKKSISLTKYNKLIRKLQIVNSQKNYATKPYDIHAEIESKAQKMYFVVNSPTKEIISLASATLRGYGMKTANDYHNILYIDINNQQETVIERDSWFIFRANINIRIDYKGLSTRVIDWKIQASSIDRETAKNRLTEQISNKVTTELFNSIITALNS